LDLLRGYHQGQKEVSDEALQLGHIQVEVGHVLDQAFDDGTVFHAFRPFGIETEADVLRRGGGESTVTLDRRA
jgi:hypothetical protein